MISQIYTILQDIEDSKDPPIIAKWNKDCTSDITRENWDQISTSFMISTSLLNIKISLLKLIHRWYLTPTRISHFGKRTTEQCWKGCGVTADYLLY